MDRRRRKTVNIGDIPAEILALIFHLVDDLAERLRLEQVCQRWRRIALTRGWRGTENCIQPLTCSSWIPQIGARCGQWFRELPLQNVGLDRRVVSQIERSLPALRHLDLRFCEWLEDAAVHSLAQTMGKKLKSLTLFETAYRPVFRPILHSFSQLQHLALHLDYHHSPGTPIADRLPERLLSLYVNSWLEFSADIETLIEVAARDCSAIEILHLETDDVSERMLEAIVRFKHLRYLRLSAHCTADRLAVCLSQLPHLQALCLLSTRIMPLDVLLSGCPHLVHLSLRISSVVCLSPLLSMSSLCSLVLDIPVSMGMGTRLLAKLEKQIVQIAERGVLKHLDVQAIPFSAASLLRIVNCQNVSNLSVKLYDPIPPIALIHSALRSQNRHTPLILWLYDALAFGENAGEWAEQSAHLRMGWRQERVRSRVNNASLEKIFRDTFNGDTPTFMREYSIC